MADMQIILNAILSKNIFEYLLIDRELKVCDTSTGAHQYMEHTLQNGDDIFIHMPEFLGSEDMMKEVFEKKDFCYTFKTLQKNEYYADVSLEYCGYDTALILLRNITKITRAEQRLLQYSNEVTLLYHALQKIIDTQSSLLFVTNSDNEIAFANKSFLHYFHTENLDEIKKKSPKIYLYADKDIKNYSALHACCKDNDIDITIEKDTFMMRSTDIEKTHKLFTLSRITDIYKRKKILETEVEMDTLTGVYRKKYFDQNLEQLLKEKDYFALIVVDIDNFKAINDTHGHTAGDEVLKEFSSLLKENIQQGDFIARWGGEEFLLTLKMDDFQKAMDHIEVLRKTVETHSFKYIRYLTASFGVAWREPNGYDDTSSLIQRADEALYRAKNGGKNRVIAKKFEQ